MLGIPVREQSRQKPATASQKLPLEHMAESSRTDTRKETMKEILDNILIGLLLGTAIGSGLRSVFGSRKKSPSETSNP
jgi:hypothetical protein